MSKNELTIYNIKMKRVGFFPNVIPKIIEYFNENSDATLIIDFQELRCYYEKFTDFSVIKQINPTKLLIHSKPHKDLNVESFYQLENLIELDNRNEFIYNFSNFPNLEILRYEWNKSSTNLSELKKIKELSLWQYKPKNQNLTEFNSLTSLTELRIIQSNIKSINGIENLQKIKEMVFIANRFLSFNNLTCTFPNVEILHIESCKEIRIEKIIKLFPNVKDLNFFSSYEIESLRIILDSLKKLEKLNVYNLKILESDNSYWKEYKNLKELNFQDRKHHILKRKDFENV
ncbi:hypothetical protein FLGE108171_00415 [Flavobacterium gelidilacus]|uniref:hypothetical protein n=1 Tax=Flavobacterium gelidilacus TaxID=206041 RepID=UPI000688EFF5|nr:hypothetical protein [Flavobacterium gelidilacus]